MNYWILKGTVVHTGITVISIRKWSHPDLFEYIDPKAVHREHLQKFFGQGLDGVYVYP
ncbi:MAG: hypothetical protein WAW52_12940 [Methanothrix sp.]